MKKLLMLCIGLLSTAQIFGQDVNDALRYASDNIEGTARFKALSGAFGALGGDMSSININPASSVVFSSSSAAFSLGVLGKDITSNYFNNANITSETNADVNQFGAAFIFRNSDDRSPWTKSALSIAYDRTANFDNDWVANGVNPNTSIVEYFHAYANGRRLDQISALDGESIQDAYNEIGRLYGFGNQQAFLGYEGYLINPENDTDDNTAYNRSINGSNFSQRYQYNSVGYNGKLAFNIATSYEDKFHIGLNLNAHFINYERNTLFSESNSNVTSTVTNVNFDNYLLATGSGFSFQLGGIAKITNELRAGLTYKSPTWYRITEETSQYLSTNRIEGGANVQQEVAPDVITVFPDYKLQTPSTLTGSLAYVFKKQGLLSFDYAIKDYSNIKFRPSSDLYFSALNADVSNLFDTAVSYRLGGEYRFNQLSFRGGYRFEESPYRIDNGYGDLTGYSLGLGYKFGNFSIDFAYSQAERSIDYQLFNVGLTNTSKIDTKFSDFALTLAFDI